MTEDREGANALVSIVMPCFGQLEYSRLSVPRLLQHSRPPFEVLFVDAGSLDGTADYLTGVAAAAPCPVEIVRGERESAFADLVAEAIGRARGAFVTWVNNDVLVTEFWLQQLLALATANDAIGVVGPTANIAPEQQCVSPIPYRLTRPQGRTLHASIGKPSLETQAVDCFAQECSKAHRGQWLELERVGGFCWLCKREVLRQVELLDNGLEEGGFDASRFSWRVRQAGFRLACCRDLYVHHFGSNLLEN